MRALATCVALVLLMTGCGVDYGPPKTVGWDLSASHTMLDVMWSDPSTDAIELRPIKVLRIALSGGRRVSEDSVIKRVTLFREDEQITELQIYSHPATVAEAHALALRWCKQWKLDQTMLDAWRADGGTEFGTISFDPDAKRDRNPEVSLDASPSFDDDKPVVVALVFFWQPPDVPAPATTTPAAETGR